jgi:hypothetical protein
MASRNPGIAREEKATEIIAEGFVKKVAQKSIKKTGFPAVTDYE